MTARAGAQREAEGIAQAQRPDSRLSRTRAGWIEERIAFNAIPRLWIESNDFSTQRAQHLGAEGSDILLRLNDSFGQRLNIVRFGGAAGVNGGITRAIAGGRQQGSVRSKYE